MMEEYGWAYMQTAPLCNEYKENVGIRVPVYHERASYRTGVRPRHLMFLQETFKKEINELLQTLLREVESRDPRKARLATTATT